MPPPVTLLALLLLAVHLLCAAAWVGGMAALHLAVRPAVQQSLDTPALRLRLMTAVLERFVPGIGLAVLLLWASGLGLISLRGSTTLPIPVLLMVGTAVVMSAVYADIAARHLPRLRAAVGLGLWPAAAEALAAVHRRVLLNLLLGIAVFLVAPYGRVG